MKYIFCFLIFAATGFSENLYQKHLPKDLYEYLAQQDFFDGNRLVNSTEKQYDSATNTITVKIAREERGRQCAVIDYWRGEAIGNFKGQLVAYQKGKLIAYVEFDAKGRDYLATLPLSSEEEREVISDTLTLLDTGRP